MSIDANPIVNFGGLADPEVPGSGAYALSELRDLCRQEVSRAVEERDALDAISRYCSLMQTPDKDDSAEDITKFREGSRVARRRLVRDFKTLYRRPRITPQTIRNERLQSLLDRFDVLSGVGLDYVTQPQSGLHPDVFDALDTDSSGGLTTAEITAGISS